MAAPNGSMRALNPEGIPEALRKQARWAPWKAVWNEKRQKWDKIPHQPTAPFYGLSTARPERWCTFEVAVAAAQAHPDVFAGVGYVMTGPHGLVGVDLDHCIVDGVLADWAREVVQQLDSYAEVSPSGTGVRVFAQGEVASDWTNHELGIEVYGGNEPRFLTVTGDALAASPAQVAPAPEGVLQALSARYARERSAPSATVITLALPDLVDELLLPDVASLGLPYQALDFLTEGVTRGDRSRELFAAAVALYGAGLSDAEVFSLLVASPHSMEVALDHRRQDSDRALMYLWVEHCQKAKGRAASRLATLDEFDDVSEAVPAGAPPSPARPRFTFDQAAAFTQRKAVTWLIKGVLPRADVGALFGESGSGKSFFALDMCMAIATGAEWRGRRVTQGTVAYVCAEGAGGFTLRLRAHAEHHGMELGTLPFFVLGDAPNLLEKADVKDLLDALRAIPGLSMIVVDTLAQVTAGANENSGEDMGRALAHCKTLSAGTKAMVLLVAHAGKDSAKGLRGWSGIKGALDVEILVERSDSYRAATITKMKDGEGEGEEFAFGLTTVNLGTNEDGDEITSCVVTAGNNVPKADRRVEPKGALQRVVLRVAGDLLALPGGVTTSALVDAAVNELPAPDQGKRDQRRAHVMRAIEALVAANALSVAGGSVTLQESAD